jgi:VIT1/CCC1 family predicted Fe2+/Mn2+ transporter
MTEGKMTTDETLKKQLIDCQRNEITEYHIYTQLAATRRSPKNAELLRKIAEEEREHYEKWKNYTGVDVKPSTWRIWKYFWIARIFGFTFAIKLMENGEKVAQANYCQFEDQFQEVEAIIREENAHEKALIDLLDEERLRYTGSVVLGLNDALVELTGALAGFTLALQNTQLIALTGSITGIAAALSMAASEYLSTRSEETDQNAIKASMYTGIAYLITVIILILPYMIFENYYVALSLTLLWTILIIAFFNYYISVAKEVPFKGRFCEMAGLSLGVAALSFFLGIAIRVFLGVEI